MGARPGRSLGSKEQPRSNNARVTLANLCSLRPAEGETAKGAQTDPKECMGSEPDAAAVPGMTPPITPGDIAGPCRSAVA